MKHYKIKKIKCALLGINIQLYSIVPIILNHNNYETQILKYDQ